MLETSAFLENSGGGSLRDEGGSDLNPVGNRWPPDETLALLKIGSVMDLAFRDSSFKAPTGDDVSRKVGELEYNRSGKKCKEKFEDMYKYHMQTKHGSSSTPNGESYGFSRQLEPFDSQVPTFATETHKATPTPPSHDFTLPCSSTSTASSSQESEGKIKKKRKLANHLERLIRDVLEKQEDLQRNLLEAIERYEKDRMAREEAWKAQETARIKKEQELLEQERALAAAKDAAVLAFLQKIAQQTSTLHVPEILNSSSEKLEHGILEKLGYLQPCVGSGSETSAKMTTFAQMGSARWPKAEVEALILLKTDLDMKYQDSGPKGPLWQEISSCMKKLGYERNAKRCKEKWENINKYYKRVKDGNKKRAEDSKTCPYFKMLDSIYAGRSAKVPGADGLKPKHMVMQMMTQKQEVVPSGNEEYGDGDSEEHQGEDGKDDEGYGVGTDKPNSVASLG